MHTHLAIAALAGLIASAAVHIVALFGVDVAARVPYVWALHIGLFAVFVPMIFLARKELGSKPSLAQLKAFVPPWALILGVSLIACAALNFLLFMAASQGGTPDIREGRFVLQNHGAILRELSAVEYEKLKANVVRGFSGHWLIFYYVPFVYFTFHPGSNPSIERTA